MGEEKKASLESLLEGGYAAVALRLVTFKRIKEHGLEAAATLKTEVKVGLYDVDALVLTGHYATKQFASLFTGTEEEGLDYEECLWQNKLIPLFVAKEGKAGVLEDEVLPVADRDNDRPALAKYKEVLKRLSRISEFEFYYHNEFDFVAAPFPFKDGVIHIFANAAPPGQTGFRHIRHAFGFNLHREELVVLAAAPTRGRGQVYRDNNEDLVQILGNNFYFLLPTISFFNETRSALLFEKALALAWNGYRKNKNAQKSQKPATETEFANEMKLRVCATVDVLKNGLAQIDIEIERLRKELAGQYAHKRNLASMARGFTEELKKDLENLPAEYSKIMAEPDVAAIFLVDAGTHVKTKPLFVECEGEKYAVGSFIIRIDEQGVVSVWSEQPLHPEGIPHPHIAKNGGPCFGNATDAITKAAANKKDCETVHYVIRWLKQGYSPELTVVKIEEWPKVSKTKKGGCEWLA